MAPDLSRCTLITQSRAHLTRASSEAVNRTLLVFDFLGADRGDEKEEGGLRKQGLKR